MPRISKEELIKLQKTLKTDDAIGKKFKITRQAVHQMRVKYGLDYNRKKNQERNEQVKKLFKTADAGVVARKLDLSVSQVYRILRHK
ncbi:MAG: hypothetical protein A2268_00975 [Candidatus Raymondbacteria bacterium RifOxyA12_full_50_37]|uniref:Resolvase HTH domain-containing protein n=1 Tax=Candidatus Raymondbacteria bacterium RIFOXYD12_FULL_49_13 TaxID=1817890 RepID=A0A1F7FG81_UNCRA|nr:MAG: hypothetical protein A2268_00975 [Candidatus Raymondbacteria bacterium RifOxyA12_full_50_37]OGJ86376.1 MAG: hypothetical protein A2248_13940 [Candidatus Raymondbacteria bacterium RIFOXYA2_FULL_49_16]OGJ95546.1 MAG: hypothetical protein A2453_12715 [Candidatus Raymondbacteria bacterium RIFOXYC2_FULL_50_21]OGJ99443.1 MAG: hypothetical protein A2487_07470 [Candidatus Raymondbacteria bacterium RifOxyC12_full_50_8]OGK04527.1 MAG: hypothetical protein A2350_18025 [Candidatus Raymondbacteria b